MIDTQKARDRQVLARLRHRPLVARNNEQEQVDPGGPGQHVLDEALMTRHVHDARLDPLSQRQRGEAEIDRQASLPLLFPAVRVNTGECMHQRRLAMIDVSRRTHDEGHQAEIRARNSRERIRTPSARW